MEVCHQCTAFLFQKKELCQIFEVCAIQGWDEKNPWTAVVRLRRQNDLLYLIKKPCQKNTTVIIITPTVWKGCLVHVCNEDAWCHFNLQNYTIDQYSTSLLRGCFDFVTSQHDYPARNG